jgi:hypothetical protein
MCAKEAFYQPFDSPTNTLPYFGRPQLIERDKNSYTEVDKCFEKETGWFEPYWKIKVPPDS